MNLARLSAKLIKKALKREILIKESEGNSHLIFKDVERLALKLISNNQLTESIKEKSKDTKEKEFITIDIRSLTTTKSRTLGSELVCQHAWDLLGLEQILKKCGFDETERTLSKSVIFGRLISPGSESHTIK